MRKTTAPDFSDDNDGTPEFATTFAALLFLAQQFPCRQFNSSELSLLSGIGRTAMSQIKNAPNTPFSHGKCSMPRLDAWLATQSQAKRA